MNLELDKFYGNNEKHGAALSMRGIEPLMRHGVFSTVLEGVGGGSGTEKHGAARLKLSVPRTV